MINKISGPGFMVNALVLPGVYKHNQHPLFLKKKNRCSFNRKTQACSTINEPNHPGRKQKSRAHRLSLKYPTTRQSPPLQEPLHWINLSNGAQVLEMLPMDVLSCNTIRFTRYVSQFVVQPNRSIT